MPVPPLRTRKLTIIAQDPSVLGPEGEVLTTAIEIPAEEISPGPRGYRVHVVDYDSSTDTFYAPPRYDEVKDGCYTDPFADDVKEGRLSELLQKPAFHAQNVYAIVMRTLARFEFALGRRGVGDHGPERAPIREVFAEVNNPHPALPERFEDLVRPQAKPADFARQ